jgi:hypothetical protein
VSNENATGDFSSSIRYQATIRCINSHHSTVFPIAYPAHYRKSHQARLARRSTLFHRRVGKDRQPVYNQKFRLMISGHNDHDYLVEHQAGEKVGQK